MAKKSFSLKKDSTTDKKISLFAMVSIALLAIFNFQNVIDNYVGLGLSATVAFIIAIVVFLFPFIFIIAEFASLIKGTKSGLTSWIHTSVGRKTAFLTSFMFWFANLTYFFSAVPSRMNYLSFAVTGSNYTEDPLYNQILPWATVAFFFIITLVSTLNTKKISKITSLGGGLMIGVTVFFFIFSIIGWIAGAIDPSLLPTTEAPGIDGAELNLWGLSGGLGFGWISTFIWVLMAADGGQSLGVYVNEVKGGKKTFIRAMLISVTIIGFSYVVGTLLASVFPPVGGLAAGWANSFGNLFWFLARPMGADPMAVAKFTNIAIGAIFFISSIGGLIVWTSAPVKVMFSEISPGIFGQKLAKENKNGVCSFGTWVQFLIVVPLMLFLMLSKGDLSSSLELIKGAAGWIGMLPWLVIFVSYINLRAKKDYEQRSFRMGNRIFGITVGVILTSITTIILFLTFFDTAPLDKPYSEWASDWYLGPVLKLVMIVLILVPAYLWYYFKFEYQIRDVKVAETLKISQNSIIDKYNFMSKLKYKYLYNDLYQNFENKKNEVLDSGKEKISNIFSQIDECQIAINNTPSSNKEEIKNLKQKIKNLKQSVKTEKKEINKNISLLKSKLSEEIKTNAENDRQKYKQEYENSIVNYINKVKEEEKNNKANLEMKSNIKNAKNEIKKEISELKNELKNRINSVKGNKDQINKIKEEFTSKEMVLRQKLEQIRIDAPYKELMLKEVETSIKKDIDLDSITIDEYFSNENETKIFETPVIYDYGFYAKKSFNDKVAISENKLLLVKDNADSLVGKEYNLENIKIIVKAKNKSIKIIHDGKWIDLDKIEFVHVENSQIESFNLYVPNSNDFIKIFR